MFWKLVCLWNRSGGPWSLTRASVQILVEILMDCWSICQYGWQMVWNQLRIGFIKMSAGYSNSETFSDYHWVSIVFRLASSWSVLNLQIINLVMIDYWPIHQYLPPTMLIDRGCLNSTHHGLWTEGQGVTRYILFNPLTLRSDQHLISLQNITPESHIKVMRIKEMITN